MDEESLGGGRPGGEAAARDEGERGGGASRPHPTEVGGAECAGDGPLGIFNTEGEGTAMETRVGCKGGGDAARAAEGGEREVDAVIPLPVPLLRFVEPSVRGRDGAGEGVDERMLETARGGRGGTESRLACASGEMDASWTAPC